MKAKIYKDENINDDIKKRFDTSLSYFKIFKIKKNVLLLIHFPKKL